MPKTKTEDKKEVEEVEVKVETKEKAEPNLLVPLEEYIKSSIHTGTRAITPGMKQYVYRRKADGIAILNTNKIDEKIKAAAKFMENYDAKDIILVCRRDVGWSAAELFGKATGVRVFLKYPPGIITNPKLETFFEPKLIITCDPYLDRNVLNDAIKIHVPVIALAGTNNHIKNIDLVVPCNNKMGKSVGLILYLLAKLYNEARGAAYPLDKDAFYSLEESGGESRGRREERRPKNLEIMSQRKSKEARVEEKAEDQKNIKALVEKLKEKKKKQAEEETQKTAEISSEVKEETAEKEEKEESPTE